MTEEHYYAVDNLGMATLCVDLQDAIDSAKEYAELYPKRAPYTVAQLAGHRFREELADKYAGQHARDSAELRNLCAARDDARKERDRLRGALMAIAWLGQPGQPSTLKDARDIADAALTQQEQS